MKRLLKITLSRLVALTLLFSFSTMARAVDVHWVLDGVLLSDGQTLTGSFDYDESTSTISNAAITNSGSALWPSQVFSGAFNPSSGYYPSTFHDGAVTTDFGETILQLFPQLLVAPYTASGVLPLDTTTPVFSHCSQAAVCPGLAFASGAEIVYVVSGQIVAVPEPEAYAMMLAGLGLVGWAARRRRQMR
ncbi:MAG: PEP-CTERM sorting domain-containing protein [Pseudomonadota bacterium]